MRSFFFFDFPKNWDFLSNFFVLALAQVREESRYVYVCGLSLSLLFGMGWM